VNPLETIQRSAALAALSRALDAGERVIAQGAAGASTALVAAALRATSERPILLVCAHLDEAEDLSAEIESVAPGSSTVFPALELAPGDSGAASDLSTRRLMVLRSLDDDAAARVLIAPIAAIMQPVPPRAGADDLIRELRTSDTVDPQELAQWLASKGYERVEAIETPGHFASRGGILDIYPPVGAGDDAAPVPVPIRLDFFGDEIDSISEVDPETLGSDRRLDHATIGPATEEALDTGADASLLDWLDASALVLLAETFEIVERGRGYFERIHDGRRIFGPPEILKALETRFHALAEINQFSTGKSGADTACELPIAPLEPFDRDSADAVRELGALTDRVDRVVLACAGDAESARLGELLSIHAPGADIERRVLDIRRGFLWEPPEGSGTFALVASGELLHRSSVRRRVSKIRAGRAIDTFLDIAEGDYVVHAEHGIARFLGLTVMDASGTGARKGVQEEFLTLEFASKRRLHVPCAQIDLVQKYVGGFAGKPPLSSIGGSKWKAQKQRVADSVKDLAAEMLRVRAAREHMPGNRYQGDSEMFSAFEAEFPYEETEDQLSAMIEIKKDLGAERPMDRLICGDVGFGKTELAIRAAFKCVESGRQAAVLVPTTVLAEQHERTFRERMADYPFRIESLSRFKSTKDINATLRDLRLGRVDVVIGTHRLLSKDVNFADLGLVVIDEEQRFGVEHKERLLQLRMTCDVLTLSATPIPRTLHMSMLGLRDISSLTTPPVDRRAIVTEVIPYNTQRVGRALERELAREGQIYFVHNRVHNINAVADEVRALVPGARVIVGHGQMEPRELESVMLDFMRRRADILVSTTIIEAGIDIPTANTMIINDADCFGLSDLHQLRGRVGRSHHRAYCYLLLPAERPVKEVARKRLKAIEDYSMLGAGFKIAMRDLEIRGAGNLLGAEQSGHIAAVGYEMYCQLLDKAVDELKGEGPGDDAVHTSVDIGLVGMIPKGYIPSSARRIEAYRRLASAPSDAAIDEVVGDLRSAYAEPPEQTRKLVLLARLRRACKAMGVRTLARRGTDLVFVTAAPRGLADPLERAGFSARTVDPELAQTNARTSRGDPYAELWARPRDPDPDTDQSAERGTDPDALAHRVLGALAPIGAPSDPGRVNAG